MTLFRREGGDGARSVLQGLIGQLFPVILVALELEYQWPCKK
jgi:hypothetical protein